MSLLHSLRDAWARMGDAWNSIGRLAARFKYKDARPMHGFRLARTGKHKDTCLTRHEQTRNPPGTKLWKMHGARG